MDKEEVVIISTEIGHLLGWGWILLTGRKKEFRIKAKVKRMF